MASGLDQLACSFLDGSALASIDLHRQRPGSLAVLWISQHLQDSFLEGRRPCLQRAHLLSKALEEARDVMVRDD